MRIHSIEHVPFEQPAAIGDWARVAGHDLSATRLYAGEGFPDPGAIDLLLVMGGPMSVHDEARHDWLRSEKRFLERALRSETPILGICLGAQLVAEVLGAEVRSNGRREIGWFPVALREEARGSALFADFPGRFPAFHWHGETFAIPAGAHPVAESTACANQGFVIGERTVGLQFHLEATVKSIAALVASCRHELTEGQFIQPLVDGRVPSSPDDLAESHRLIAKLVERLLAGRLDRG